MRLALDTNVVVYARGIDGADKEQAIHSILDVVPKANIYVPVQALGEFFNVLVKKTKCSPKDARQEILNWHKVYPVIATSENIMLAAADLAVRHQLNFWDSVIMAASASVGCDLLLSEDMQDGFTWNGVTIVNPFASSMNPLLQAVLKQCRSRL